MVTKASKAKAHADESSPEKPAAEAPIAETTERRPAVRVADKSARTVTVACKLPSGLALQLQRPMRKFEDSKDGPKQMTYNVKFGKIYYVNGPAYPVGPVPKGFPKPAMIEGGYALTRGIPKEFWDQWEEQNKMASYLTPEAGQEHGAIFAFADIDDTVACARENESFLTGFEPMSTDTDSNGRLTDPRVPRPMTGAIARIAPDDDRMNARRG